MPDDERPESDCSLGGHCWHPMTAPYAVATPSGDQAPAIGECCCHCGSSHVKILMARPDDAEGHGPHLVFVEPKLKSAPKPALIVPNGPRLLH